MANSDIEDYIGKRTGGNEMTNSANKSLPHIHNITAGQEYYDPNHSSIFEVSFGLPKVLENRFTNETLTLLPQQITKVSGLDILQKTSAANSQKFYGVDVSFLNPVMDTTVAEITITFNLNLNHNNDNYVLRILRAWARLGYDMNDGSRSLMVQYCAPWVRINEANRNGWIWRTYTFHKVMLTGLTGINDLDYTNNDARTIDATFRADWWNDSLGVDPEDVNEYVTADLDPSSWGLASSVTSA